MGCQHVVAGIANDLDEQLNMLCCRLFVAFRFSLLFFYDLRGRLLFNQVHFSNEALKNCEDGVKNCIRIACIP